MATWSAVFTQKCPPTYMARGAERGLHGQAASRLEVAKMGVHLVSRCLFLRHCRLMILDTSSVAFVRVYTAHESSRRLVKGVKLDERRHLARDIL